MNLVYTIINLVVLYLLMRHFLIRPVTQIMEKRKQMVEEGFKNAQDMQEQAARMKREYEEALSGAKQESLQIVDNARKSAKAEYDRIIGEAGDKAGSMIEAAKETVRVEREKTMKELQSQIAGLAVASAVRIVGGQAEAQADSSLYDQFLKETRGEGSKNEDR